MANKSFAHKNILFTGGRSPVTLDLIRLFYKADYNVFIAESVRDNLAGKSKYTKKNILVPSPAMETEEFINSLIDIIKEYRISTLVPTCEEVFYISKYKEKLEKYCYVFTSSIDALTELHSKYNFVELLKKLEINYPESKLLDNINDVKNEISKIDTFVLKPEFSRFASLVIINDKNPKKLDKMKISKEYPWVLQQFIKGQAFCSYSAAQNGKLVAHSIYPSILRAGQGATIHFENVNIPEIDEIVEKIVRYFNFTGQISFDFIMSDYDHKIYPIECNPRATSGVYLFSPKDNLPDVFMKDYQGDLVRANPERAKMVGLAMILYGLPKIRSVKQGKDLWNKFISSEDVIFKIRDIKPFISQFTSLSYYSSQARKNDVSLLEASTIDIEWNGN